MRFFISKLSKSLYSILMYISGKMRTNVRRHETRDLGFRGFGVTGLRGEAVFWNMHTKQELV